MPTEGLVGLPADSTGKKLRTQTVTTTVAGSAANTEQQVVSVGDPTTTANVLLVNPDGSLSVRLVAYSGGNSQTPNAGFQIGTQTVEGVNIAGSQYAGSATSGSLTGSGTSVVVGVASAGNVTVALIGGTYTNLPIVFEATVDNTNWFGIDATKTDGTSIVSSQGTVIPSSGNMGWNITVPGYTQVRIRQTAAATAQSANPTVVMLPGPLIHDASPTVAPMDSYKATYVAVQQGLGANLASDIVALRGSATKTVRVTCVEVSIVQGGTITAAQTSFSLVKRTTANTGGTTVVTPIQAMDSADPAATATCVGYTVAATGLGTGNPIRRQNYAQTATAAGANPPTYVWDFGNRPEKCPVLHGVNEQLAINNALVAAGTSPTLAWTVNIEFTEE